MQSGRSLARTLSTARTVGGLGGDGANVGDDGQTIADLLGEAAAHAVEAPNHLWGGVIDDTRYGAWRSAGFP